MKRVISKVLKRKKGTARTVGLVRGAKRQARPPRAEKPASAAVVPPMGPVELTFRDYVHDAICGLEAARRAFDNLRVHEFRGNPDAARLEDVIFHEELERVLGWLVRLDLEMPEGGAS